MNEIALNWFKTRVAISKSERFKQFGKVAIAALERQQWISAEKKLPETNGEYLCVCDCFGNQSICVVRFATNLEKIDKYDFAKKRKSGWYAYDGEWGYYERDSITHWMPLPSLPKKEDADGLL